MSGFCPHIIFVNTKADLGTCQYKYHDELLKTRFTNEASPELRKEFEMEFFKYLEKLVHDLDRRIRRGQERCAFLFFVLTF